MTLKLAKEKVSVRKMRKKIMNLKDTKKERKINSEQVRQNKI